MFKNILSKWKRLSIKAGNFQATVIFTLFYFLIITPFAIVIKVFADPLKIKKRNVKWCKREIKENIVEEVRKQF